ncbi:MAG: PKD domain-containing protein, partial [Deltaproteobacteria bacterium]|nr:PKD domain-containing protein [Deltaproteobacteria bacterium]
LTIELQVTDDGDPPLSSERAATLIFAVNLPPVAAICGNELDPAGLDPTAPPEDCRQEDVQGLEGEPLSFTALASDPGAGDRLTYSWSFTEEPREWEAAEDPENPHISHTFPADGTYPVSLRVEDGDGGEAQVQLVVTIGNRPPAVASFPDVQGEEGKVVQLRAEASDPGDDRLGYSWDFGDGQTTTTVEPVVEHVFADSGSYTVRLTVSDDGGGVTETSAEAVIANRPPSAAIVNPPLVALEGDELSFSGDGSDPSPSDNRGLAYLWDFGDGSEPREGRVVNHVFVDEGSGRFEVTLTVTDPDGATATAKTGVLVSNVRPTLGDMPDLQAEEGIPIVFTAPVSDPGSADQMTFTWNVGEAAAVERREPTLSWTFTDDRAQPFLVRVEVDDGDGGTDRTSFQVTVTNRPPRFVADPPPPAVAQQGQPYGYELSAVDEGADVLTFHLDASPAGMTLSPQGAGKAQLSWTPALDQIDLPFSVSVRVDDGDGGEDVLSWVVQVEGFVD